MEEIFKDIAGYEGLYQISNYGNVKSFPRKGTDTKEERILKVYKNKKGYNVVYLYKDNIKKTKQVHRLIAEAFISNPDNLPQVNHKDENKLNNCIDNLEWCTEKYNNNYGTRIKRMIEKNRNNSCCKKVSQYDLEGNKIKTWNSIHEASRSLNLSYQNIWHCINGNQKTCNGFVWKYEKGE